MEKKICEDCGEKFESEDDELIYDNCYYGDENEDDE